jgi:hypothetical protein
MPVYIIGGREHRHHKCEDGRVLMMRKVKSRKEYYCDDCNQTIKKGDQYFCLDMSPGQYYQLYESFDHENLSIIKRACVRCVEKEFVEGRTASEMEKEESILRLLENKSLSLTEARA